MIRIEINEEFLKLGENTSLSFTIENPFFDNDNIINSPRTLNFNIPDDSEGYNRNILDYVNMIGRRHASKLFPCWIWLFNNRWMYGNIVVNYSNGSFECHFIQLLDIIDLFKGNLRDTDLETIIDWANFYDEMRDRVDVAAATKDFVHFPVYNPNFFDNADDTATVPYWGDNYLKDNYGRYINYWFDENCLAQGEFYIQNITLHDYDFHYEYAMSPAIYVKWMFEKLFAGFGIFINDQGFFSEEDIQKLVIWTNRTFYYAVKYNHLTSAYTIYFQTSSPFNLNNYIPDITVSDFLAGLKKNFALTYYFDPTRKSIRIIPNRDILSSADFSDWSTKVLAGYEIEQNETNGFKLLPTLSDDELFSTRIKETKNLILLTAVNTFASLTAPASCELGDCCLVLDEQKYYQVILSSGSKAWTYYCDYYDIYYYGNGNEEMASPADVLLRMFNSLDVLRDVFFAHFTNAYWTIPESYEANDSAIFETEDKEESLRLLFYRGMQLFNSHEGVPGDLEGYPDLRPESEILYPYATHTELDPKGNLIGDYSLAWKGDYGLYEKWWRTTIEFLAQTKTVKKKLALTPSDILSLDLSKKILITEPGHGSIKYLIKKLTVTITMSGLQPAEAELSKL